MIEEPAIAPKIVHFGVEDLGRRTTLTPHTDLMRSPIEELQATVEESSRAITDATHEAILAIARVVNLDHIVVVGVIAAKSANVEDLRQRVKRRRYAEFADEHLVSGAVVAAVERAGLPVLAVTGPEALKSARAYFGRDRKELGEEAKRAQPALGRGFEYHHRLPTLAARVALAGAERDGPSGAQRERL